MATFQEQLIKVKQLNPNRLQTDLFDYIRSLENELIQLEKDRLFKESKDIFGKPIGFYSKTTEIISKGRKKQGQPFTAFDTGDFFKGFYASTSNEEVKFSSDDKKTKIILSSENWLSNSLFGLSDNELKKVIAEKLLPFFIQNFRKILDL